VNGLGVEQTLGSNTTIHTIKVLARFDNISKREEVIASSIPDNEVRAELAVAVKAYLRKEIDEIRIHRDILASISATRRAG
jgi:hypothetical protein